MVGKIHAVINPAAKRATLAGLCRKYGFGTRTPLQRIGIILQQSELSEAERRQLLNVIHGLRVLSRRKNNKSNL